MISQSTIAKLQRYICQDNTQVNKLRKILARRKRAQLYKYCIALKDAERLIEVLWAEYRQKYGCRELMSSAVKRELSEWLIADSELAPSTLIH